MFIGGLNNQTTAGLYLLIYSLFTNFNWSHYFLSRLFVFIMQPGIILGTVKLCKRGIVFRNELLTANGPSFNQKRIKVWIILRKKLNIVEAPTGFHWYLLS